MLVLDFLMRSTRHLFKLAESLIMACPLPMVAIRGMIYAGVCIPGRQNLLAKGLQLLPQALSYAFDKNGCVKSRNPCDQLYMLRDLVDIRKVLCQGSHDVPEIIDRVIQLVMQRLQAMRQSDNSLAPFHGGFPVDGKIIDKVMSQAGPRPRLPTSFTESGYMRIQNGRSLLLIDTGRRPQSGHHAPASFIFGHGRERLFVNCGNRGTGRCEQSLARALKQSGAHTTLQVERGASVRRDPGKFRIETEIIKDDRGTGVMLTHDAYTDATNILHRRSLWLEIDGHTLHGEDLLYTADPQYGFAGDIKPMLRFHLDARVTASLIRNQTEVLLRTPNRMGWRFEAGGLKLKLSDSIQTTGPLSKPRSSQQIVVTVPLDDPQPRATWSLTKESQE